MEFKGHKAKDMLSTLYHTAKSGISYVGAANYASREYEANKSLDDKFDYLYDKCVELDEVNNDLLEALQSCVFRMEQQLELDDISVNKQEFSTNIRIAREAIEKALK
jgi:hypothetical protein